MKTPAGKNQWRIWGGLALATAAMGVALVSSRLGAANGPLPVIGRLPSFTLTNQDNQAVSFADLRGKVWIADLIFTRCPTTCRVMSAQFEKLQNWLPDGACLVSFTSDPLYDTPPILKKFAGQFNADPKHWRFLTGKPSEVHDLEINDFKFAVVEKKPEERSVPDDWFTHSTWFALVDRDGQMRGWVDADGHEHAVFESDDPAAMARLKSAIKQLLQQPVT